MLPRVAQVLKRHGAVGTVSIAARKVAPSRAYAAAHVWYSLPLDGSHPHRELDRGLELRRGGEADVVLLEQLPQDPAVLSLTREDALQRLGDGAELWLVTEADRAAFACWIFRRRTPVWAARGGWLALPEDVVCLEDSLASPAFRGRGVAPAAWSGVAAASAASGALEMVTKVAVQNAPSRRAVEKAGFVVVGEMHAYRRAWRTRVGVELAPGREATHGWLKSLARER